MEKDRTLYKTICLFMVLGFFVIATLFFIAYTYTVSTQIVQVHITENGFIPSEVRIRQNDIVQWVNDDNRSHIPASDPHPIHTALRGFEPNTPIAPGASWNYTFLEPGKWYYHDHLVSHFRGVVVVEDSFMQSVTGLGRSMTNRISAFFNKVTKRSDLARDKSIPTADIKEILSQSSAGKMAPLIRSMTEEYGPRETLRALRISGLPFTGETHLAIHSVGDVAYEKFGDEALRYCDESFLSACYHGVLLHALAENGLHGVEKMIAVCKDNGVLVFTQCAHAAGHGFLAYEDYLVLDGLALCDRLGELNSEIPLFNCYDGVFMENVFGVHNGALSVNRLVKEDDPYFPCNSVPEKYRSGCWANQASLAYQLFNGDLTKVAKLCDSLEESQYQQTCYNNFARQIHPLTGGETDKVFTLCAHATGEWERYCHLVIMGAGFSVGDRTQMPYEICARAANDEKEGCYNRLMGMMPTYAPDEDTLAQFCSYILESRWQDTCFLRHNVSKESADNVVGKNNEAALENQVIRRIESGGVQAGYAYLKALKSSHAEDALHDLAHLVGFKAYGSDGAQGVDLCDTDFAFGCYHGFFEEFIKQEGDASLAAAERSCLALQFAGHRSSCVHGIGHGVMGWVATLEEALSSCDRLQDAYQTYCYDGVFMEYLIGMVAESRKNTLAGDSFSFCLGLEKKYQPVCVRNMVMASPLASKQGGEGLQPLSMSCRALADSSNYKICVETIGLRVGRMFRGETKNVQSFCKVFSSDEDVSRCIIAAGREMMFQKMEAGQDKQICNLLTTLWREQCRAELQDMQTQYGIL